MNVFTRERIRLPSLEDIDESQMRFERTSDSDFLVTFGNRSYVSYSSGKSSKVGIKNAVLWVDEKSRDYIVVWYFDCFFAYHKKSYCSNSWKVFQLFNSQGCVNMVLKESKL